MSENAVVVVELSVMGADASSRLVATKDWLLETEVIARNERRDDLWQPSEYRAVAIAPPLAHEHIRGLANNGVDFLCERQVHHPIENDEPPACPSCTVQADPDAHMDLIEGWLEKGEPAFGCGACGKSHPAGDWIGNFSSS